MHCVRTDCRLQFCSLPMSSTEVHSLLHTVQNLIMDNHWRIRQGPTMHPQPLNSENVELVAWTP